MKQQNYKSAKYRVLNVSLSNSPKYRYYETIIIVLMKWYVYNINSETNEIIRVNIIKNYNKLKAMPFYLKVKLSFKIWQKTSLRYQFYKLA